MSVSMLMILDMIVSNTLQHEIGCSRCDGIQSYYLAESKILMSLYEDKYYKDQLYPAIVDVFWRYVFDTKLKSVIIDKSDLEGDDSSSYVRMYFTEEEARKRLLLVGKSNYKGIETSVKSSATIVNKLFEIYQPILSMDIMEDEYKDDLEKLLINIEENITINNLHNPESSYAKEVSNYSHISLNKCDRNNYKLTCSRETMTYPDIEGFNKAIVYLIIKSSEVNKAKLHIDCSDLPASLSGIIYVEGDLEITGEFTFNGIIIVKDGEVKVNGDLIPIVKGMMILYNNENIVKVNDEIDLLYDRFPIYKYGTFLPGFVDLDLKSIKNGGI